MPSPALRQSSQTHSKKQPVWLLSMDSESFHAAPTTTATLKAYYQTYGQSVDDVNIELVHFKDAQVIPDWQQFWLSEGVQIANAALEQGHSPIVGISFYTWNAAEFLALATVLKESCPDLLIVAGGPHVQQAEDYIGVEAIDIVVLGEGENTFVELIDQPAAEHWPQIDGIAFAGGDGAMIKTAERTRIRDLSTIPSPFALLPLTNEAGEPLYESVSIETSRGCPFKCSFCEWGTGAIGTKLLQFPLERVKADFDAIISAGVQNIWLADSNFGAHRADVEKAKMICDFKRETGLPRTFATSWSKTHNRKVQDIVLMLNEHDLLPHYQLALQTLTPLALELCQRDNMGVNEYAPIAKQMAKDGVPIAAELIWGLPGDNLAEFESNLDVLLAIFPSINIFGYILLPGTEFYERRSEFQLQTIAIEGYGKAKGEQVIATHTYDRNEGVEGYFMISAHLILVQGWILPMTTRYLCLDASIPCSPMLREVMARLIEHFLPSLANVDMGDKLTVYEQRDQIYLQLFQDWGATWRIIHETVGAWLTEHGASRELQIAVHRCLRIDQAFAPRSGQSRDEALQFDFDVRHWQQSLEGMELPVRDIPSQQLGSASEITLHYPGGVGELLLNPVGGRWVRAEYAKANQVCS